MTDYKAMYLAMFRAAEQARRLLTEEPFTRSNAQKAVQLLELAQLKCEEIYIESSDE